MTDDDIYTNDGTVTLKNERAIKKKTGNWRACPFILGMLYISTDLYIHTKYIHILFWFISFQVLLDTLNCSLCRE